MPKQVIINCLITSLIFSLVAPSFLLITFVPIEGAAVYDVTDIDHDRIDTMSTEEATEYINNEVKLRKVTGVERFTYYPIFTSYITL